MLLTSQLFSICIALLKRKRTTEKFCLVIHITTFNLLGDQGISAWTLSNFGAVSPLAHCQTFECATAGFFVSIGTAACSTKTPRHHSVWKSLGDPSYTNLFFFPPKVHAQTLIARRLPEETHELFKQGQTLDWTESLPGEHFLCSRVTCHKTCLTHIVTDSWSQTGSLITDWCINSLCCRLK